MPDRYLVAADSGYVALINRAGGASSCLARVAITSAAPEALLRAAETVLSETGAQGGAAEVWLGSAWARLLALDWPDAPLDRGERKALLDHHWSAVLPDATSWRLLVAEHGSPRLSVAMPASLVDGLGALLASRRIKPRSLLPAVCGALQYSGVRDGAVLLGEGDRMTLVRCEGGEVRGVAGRRVISDEDPLEWAAGAVAGARVLHLAVDPVGTDPACVEWGGLWV